ncbi:hypothetical protein [Marinobacter zhejiangensis]|uniref:Lipoprotein n=1 Tax=Marinobacter zhejiangensis TaxID=488535 RepID=A0A1I4PYL3_9GAMM|nr:hypothetical protein [Marinobacter zhejiangensis]SFM32907.1 hypothetical protein SAMN04487963_2079 [Marinobacter zhejiangensis]
MLKNVTGRLVLALLAVLLASGCQLYRKANDPIHTPPPPDATAGRVSVDALLTTSYREHRYRLVLVSDGPRSGRSVVATGRAGTFTLDKLHTRAPEVEMETGAALTVSDRPDYELVSSFGFSGAWRFDPSQCRIQLVNPDGQPFAVLNGAPVSVLITVPAAAIGTPSDVVYEPTVGFSVTEARVPELVGQVFFDLSREWGC